MAEIIWKDITWEQMLAFEDGLHKTEPISKLVDDTMESLDSTPVSEMSIGEKIEASSHVLAFFWANIARWDKALPRLTKPAGTSSKTSKASPLPTSPKK